MQRTQRLQGSKEKKDDEYYTLFQDVADEVSLYLEQLKGKRILCPCDWDESYNEEIVFKEEGYIINRGLFSADGTIKQIDISSTKEKIEKNLNLIKCQFVYYLINQADIYNIKSISVSGYNPKTGEGVRFQDIDYSNYDVVITNPPFSQFREFIETLINSQIKFLVIGPQNALTYKEIIQHFQNNELWLGYHYHLSGFKRPDGTILPKQDLTPRSCMWFTNMDVSIRQKMMILSETYNENTSKYPKYVNYNAIEVGHTNDIPMDYDGLMGVPISFLQKYNPKQFEIIGSSIVLGIEKPHDIPKDKQGGPAFYLKLSNGTYKRLFSRIVIRKRI